MSHLYKRFVNERAAQLLTETERIRNCTVIAHIDHGKTTLTDSLIAASGLLSKEVAASARLLDYDLIEQERGITIKASSISLIHNMDSLDYLINLIDTPGHIDFSSHVTRGLRLTDGAIVVVDVIEGIMVQTETVTRQAMEELVRPILFVNKVDRLIKERRLDARKTAEEINKVVREFNAMLGKYLDDELLEKWEVSLTKGSLCIGSALHKWGLDLKVLKVQSGGKEDASSLANAFIDVLEDIVTAYHNEDERKLSEKYPVAKVLLDSVLRTTPNPETAQSYRIPAFWPGDPNSNAGKALLNCDSNGPLFAVVGDVKPDRHAGTVATIRIFSGELVRGKPIYNLRNGTSGKSLQIGLLMSKSRIALPSIPAGNLAFITGLRDIVIGDTLTSDEAKDEDPIGTLHYPTEPVVTYTIEPKVLAELSEIQEPLADFAKIDPALEFEINAETGEMLLSGAGELHIEISVEKLARQGTRVILSEPMVLLKEQLTKDGATFSGGNETTSKFSVKAVITGEDMVPHPAGAMLFSEARTGNYLVDTTNAIDLQSDVADWLREAFKILIRSGPVSGERIRHLTVLIERAEIQLESPETSWRDVTQPFMDATRASVASGKPVVLEPWVRLEISTPEDHVGNLTAILAKRKGQVLEINSERSLYKIEAEIPVRESFGLANEIRTTTSGWATWGARAGGYRQIGTGKYKTK